MPPIRPLAVVLAALALALSGCQPLDPYQRTDVWTPTGANAGNIAAMVANPQDLIRGHGTPIEDAHEPVTAVGHVWNDQPKPLGFTGGGGSGGGGSSGGGGGSSSSGSSSSGSGS
jgi:type IV pilus biogenesis protein CpaD/CtpE